MAEATCYVVVHIGILVFLLMTINNIYPLSVCHCRQMNCHCCQTNGPRGSRTPRCHRSKWSTDGSPRNEPVGSDRQSQAASCKYTRYIVESHVTQQALMDNFNALKQVVQSQITSREDDWTGREQHHPFHPFSSHPCPSKSTRQNQG